MGLVIAGEHDLGVAGEYSCECCPEGLKAGIVSDDVSIIAAEVVRIDDGVGSFGVGNVVYDGG